MPARHKPGSKAELDQLRHRMRRLGASIDVVAAEITRRYDQRPRAAYRLAAGCDQPETARRYNALIQSRGPEHAGRDSMTPSRVSEYERWPLSRSTRKPSTYVLRALAELFGTAVDRLVDHADLEAMTAIDRAAITAATGSAVSTPRQPDVDLTEDSGRRRQRAELVRAVLQASSDGLKEFIVESADQSSEAAVLAEASNVGESTIAILQQQMSGLAAEFESTPPRLLLSRTLVVRNRTLELLEGRQSPNHARDLHAVAGAACALLAWVSGDLAQHHAALAHGTAAWVFARRAEQPLLSAFVRTTMAKSAYWANRVTDSALYAADGLDRLPDGDRGTLGVLLASMLARANARLGNAEDTMAALGRAEQERQLAGDDPDGGLYSCSVVGQQCFAAGAHLTLGDPGSALAAVDAAERAYEQAGPTAFRSITMARINAITAHLSIGDIDAARHVFQMITDLPADRRIETFAQRLGRATNLLSNGTHLLTHAAAALLSDIRDFQHHNARRALPT